MTDQELNTLMKRILIDSLRLDMQEDATECTVSFNPSIQYKRQMKTMLQDPLSWSRRKIQSIWKSIAKKIAVILLIISLGFGTLIVSSPTVRAALARWITEWYETHIVYRYTGDSTSEGIPQYEITDIPESFVESERTELPRMTSITYENEAGDVIYFEL